MSKPVIRLNMKGPDGNIFAVLAEARNALRSAYVSSEMISRATRASNYEDSLSIVREYVTIEEVT